MSILSFLKPKNKEKHQFNNKVSQNTNSINVVLGQILYCKNGEQVTVVGLHEDIIRVSYNSRIYERQISCIGTKLLINNPILNSTNLDKESKIDYSYDYNYSYIDELIDYEKYVQNDIRNYILYEERANINGEYDETPLERMYRWDREVLNYKYEKYGEF